MYGEKLFLCPEKEFWREINTFFAIILSRMDLGNVDMQRMQVFDWISMKYVIKYTDKLLFLHKVYCEIYIV